LTNKKRGGRIGNMINDKHSIDKTNSLMSKISYASLDVDEMVKLYADSLRDGELILWKWIDSEIVKWWGENCLSEIKTKVRNILTGAM
jgi:hypothetical protein